MGNIKQNTKKNQRRCSQHSLNSSLSLSKTLRTLRKSPERSLSFVTRSFPWMLSSMLNDTWARGMKSITPKTSLSSLTMPSASLLSIPNSLMTVTLKCTTQARAASSGSLASVSTVMLSALLTRSQASATSSSLHPSQDGTKSPTTRSLTLITTTTQLYTLVTRTTCSICGSCPELQPFLKN